jgi:Fur family transcriptional regulator, ferric uptake regulator
MSNGKKSKLPCGRGPELNVKRAVANKASMNQNWEGKLLNHLKNKGLRHSDARIKVTQVAAEAEEHFDIQQLVLRVQKKFKDIGAATVYRTVKTLVDAGILRETFQGEAGVSLFEFTSEDHHDHIVCVDCGSIFEFYDDGLEVAQQRTVQSHDFEEVRHQHVIYARCTRLAR